MLKLKLRCPISRFRRRKTVGDVLTKFTKTIDELYAIEKNAVARGWRIEEQVSALREEQEAADREADTAQRIGEKLKALVE